MKICVDSNVLVASVKKRGERYHRQALELARRISEKAASCVASALVLIEVPGALASSTKMPIEKIQQVLVSMQDGFRLSIMSFDAYTELARDLMLEFRELKSEWEIGSADFHHLATSIGEGCDMFVTTDEKHLLRPECKRNFERHIVVTNPDEALDALH